MISGYEQILRYLLNGWAYKGKIGIILKDWRKYVEIGLEMADNKYSLANCGIKQQIHAK